ncbi:MAG: STAS/SEC14 domain-containing protein [Gammaproteobacteria bacterium]|nr:STAS/SEC14 domain-containing protein [Gammaproteobacteria bacterium]
MLSVTFDESRSIITLEPDNPLTIEDFQSASRIIDEHLSLKGSLKGIIIQTKAFPGWTSFQAFLGHLKFIKDHHKWVKHVALVTNSPVALLVETLEKHFINAKIKQFSFDEEEHARGWILNDNDYGEV